ncbi:hypothetical protein PI125_g25560 [Phytophthora idaei]|nr:hypothetical protein PI125_g25560 [Phytophthora idaei]
MEKSYERAERAKRKKQVRQAKYYNRGARQRRTFAVGGLVWVYKPPRGRKASKFVHQWMDPMRIVEFAGYENYLLEREDKNSARETMLAHVSFLVSCHYPEPLLTRAAADILEELRGENNSEERYHDEALAAPVRAAAETSGRRKAAGAVGRRRKAVGGEVGTDDTDGTLEGLRRSRRRNRGGQCELEPAAIADDEDTFGTSGEQHVREWIGRTAVDMWQTALKSLVAGTNTEQCCTLAGRRRTQQSGTGGDRGNTDGRSMTRGRRLKQVVHDSVYWWTSGANGTGLHRWFEFAVRLRLEVLTLGARSKWLVSDGWGLTRTPGQASGHRATGVGSE